MRRVTVARAAALLLASFIAILAILLGPTVVRAGTSVHGYFIDRVQAEADRPRDLVHSDGDFTLAIHRRYDDPLGARLLRIAEATYPPRERLIDIAITRGYEVGSDSARTPLWWCDGLGVGRVPYAITLGAVEHYTNLTERFRAHNFRGAWDHNLYWTEFHYEASITRKDRYYLPDSTVSNVYVADMSLSWSYDDGTFIPMSLAHRVVVLSPDGRVISVEGDGYTDEQVYMSSHRGIGRVERLMR